MPMIETIRYFKVVGSRTNSDGMVAHYAVQVADFAGTPLSPNVPTQEEIVQTTAANEQPRGTIAKVTFFSGKTVQLNPTA